MGVPFFAGYFSKDAILEAAWARGSWEGFFCYIVGVLSAGLTALYSLRLMMLAFHGKTRADERVIAHIHEAPLTMLLPLAVLAFGAIFCGYILQPIFFEPAAWTFVIKILPAHDLFKDLHHLPLVVKVLPLVIVAIASITAVYLYAIKAEIPGILMKRYPGLYKILYNKWYFDELYQFTIVKPSLKLANILWKVVDQSGIDRLGPGKLTRLSQLLGEHVSQLQTGHMFHYAIGILGGLVVLCTILFLGGSLA